MARSSSRTSPPPSPYRVRPPRDPVTVTLDGVPVLAERGAPLADAFVAAGKLTLARSPKFHRPRGPACFRAACDGCLARVDETPNVMTCMVGAEDGTAVVTQNRIGPREGDLLRMADWFFPEGMNHHELFAGIPGMQTVMQVFARRIAGLGKLPLEAVAERPAARRRVDVLVIGAGPSGMALAAQLAAAGRRVEVIDDQLERGGGARGLRAAFAAEMSAFDQAVDAGKVRLRTATVAGGIYQDDVLVVGEDGAEIVTARTLVLACGAHDGVLAFEGNDLPGIVSARAAGQLLARGVLVGKRILVVVPDGGGPFGTSFTQAVKGAVRGLEGVDVEVSLVRGEPVVARGGNRVTSVVVKTKEGDREVVTDALVLDAPRSPAYELALQAGAEVTHEARGFVVETEDGRIRPGLYAVGELAGVALDADAIAKNTALVSGLIANESR